MPSTFRIEFDHTKEVAKRLHDAAKDIVAETAESVLERAQAGAPVDTSFLQKSGYTVTSEHNGYASAAGAAASVNSKGAKMLEPEEAPPNDTTAYVAFGAAHAVPVHEGTSHMGARPFLAQAMADESGKWLDRWQHLEERLG